MGSSEECPFSSNGTDLVGDDGCSSSKNVSFVESLPVHVKEFIAGGAAGAFAKVAASPFDRIKLLLQLCTKEFQCTGVYPSLKQLTKHEGVQRPIKGIGDGILGTVPYAAIYFMTFERYRYWLLNYTSFGMQPIVDLLSGTAAGGTAVLCTYPLDLARTKLAIQMVDNTHSFRSGMSYICPQPGYYGLQNVFRSVYKEGGLRALYHGVGSTLLEVLPYAGLKIYIYEELKRQVPEEQQKSVMTRLYCGTAAGFLGQTFTYPLDVVRRQLQVESSHEGGPKYKTTLEGFILITQSQGWRQLVVGLSTKCIKVVPVWAIGLTAYDMMKSWLSIPPHF